MFKSTEDYNKAIYNVLLEIQHSNSFLKPTDELNEIDLGDVINLCNNRGYIDGVHIQQNATGYYFCSGSPRLTYRGLEFIESFNK